MERISVDPVVALDGAHNPQGCAALEKAMALTDKKKIVIMGMLRDKDWAAASAKIGRQAAAVFAVAPDNPRALPGEELARELKKVTPKVQAFTDLQEAIAQAALLLDKDTALFCCGSLYLAAELRPLLQKRFAEK